MAGSEAVQKLWKFMWGHPPLGAPGPIFRNPRKPIILQAVLQGAWRLGVNSPPGQPAGGTGEGWAGGKEDGLPPRGSTTKPFDAAREILRAAVRIVGNGTINPFREHSPWRHGWKSSKTKNAAARCVWSHAAAVPSHFQRLVPRSCWRFSCRSRPKPRLEARIARPRMRRNGSTWRCVETCLPAWPETARNSAVAGKKQKVQLRGLGESAEVAVPGQK